MKDLYNFYTQGKGLKKSYNRGKSFGYQILGFGSGIGVAEATFTPTTLGIFGFGYTTGPVGMTNLVNSSGVVASDTSAVGTAREAPTAGGYGGDKAIFAYGVNEGAGEAYSLKNLVNNSGVVAVDVTGVGTPRWFMSSATYGTDKVIMGFGKTTVNSAAITGVTNLVSNTGVVASDSSAVGTARSQGASCRFSADKAIFAYGSQTGSANNSNLVSNLGLVASNTTGVGTNRIGRSGTNYGVGLGIFCFGETTANKNLVSNVGVISGDVTGVGSPRNWLGSTSYGSDKAIYYGGYNGGAEPVHFDEANLVTNLGIVGTDQTGVGTRRRTLVGGGYAN